MHIRSIGVAINCSFCNIFRVISIPFEYFSQGLSCTQVCTTTMILKSDQSATIPADGYISNTPRYAWPFMNCPRIENSQSSFVVGDRLISSQDSRDAKLSKTKLGKPALILLPEGRIVLAGSVPFVAMTAPGWHWGKVRDGKRSAGMPRWTSLRRPIRSTPG